MSPGTHENSRSPAGLSILPKRLTIDKARFRIVDIGATGSKCIGFAWLGIGASGRIAFIKINSVIGLTILSVYHCSQECC